MILFNTFCDFYNFLSFFNLESFHFVLNFFAKGIYILCYLDKIKYFSLYFLI